jgi:hypothetical protein
MNKIYLDKLLEFSHSTYSNYYGQYNKKIDLADEITKIKQNTSLNEKGSFLKYSFVDLSNLITSIEYDSCVLIYPICFNIEDNPEWFNLLNCLLLILNDDYIKESNIGKKKILQIADKMYKKHLTIGKSLNEENYQKISELTNLNLIILNNENNSLKITEYAKSKMDKWVICYKFGNNYFPIWNFDNKYFTSGSNLTKYLQTFLTKNNTNDEPDDSTKDLVEEHTTDDSSQSADKVDTSQIQNTSDEQILVKGRKNNEAYEEFLTNENYALYISEAVDTANTKKQKVKKDSDKKKNKTNKNIFVAPENDNLIQTKDKGTNANNVNNVKDIGKQITGANVLLTESVFKKTEQIDKAKVSQIISNIKTTTKLEQIQAYALELGLSIASGATKDGKPKNKTKNELIDEIKKLNLSL